MTFLEECQVVKHPIPMSHQIKDSSRGLVDEIIDRQNLANAWEQVLSKKGAPGVDGVTLERWARNWDINIERLREQVKTNTYRASPPRRFFVPKKNGGKRELSILTITDRVLQRAAVNVLSPIFEERFLPCSHGYRPDHSTSTAIQQVLSFRDQGFTWLLDADIDDCFYSLDHQLLVNLVKQVVKDWHTLNLIERWLLAGRKSSNQAVGIPMGSVIAPLMCNVYLHQLDACLCTHQWKIVRYADDFVVLSKNEDLARESYRVVKNILDRLLLAYNEEKTRITDFEEGFSYLGVSFQGNSFSYDYKKRRICVEGSSAEMLILYPPQFY